MTTQKIVNSPVKIPVKHLNPGKVVSDSVYQHEYPKKTTEIESKFVVTDNLKTGGPLIGLTTYQENFLPKISPTMSFVTELLTVGSN